MKKFLVIIYILIFPFYAFSVDIPLKNGFEIQGSGVSYGPNAVVPDGIPTPAFTFNGNIINIENVNEFFKHRMFHAEALYAFINSEFKDYEELEKTKGIGIDYNPPLSSISNPGRAAEIFDHAIDLSHGYFQGENDIVLQVVHRELGFMVGAIRSVENLRTKFSAPLTYYHVENIFGSPDYFVVRRIDRYGEQEMLYVYDFPKFQFIFIFDNLMLCGVSILEWR
jgi:hypothetical protein